MVFQPGPLFVGKEIEGQTEVINIILGVRQLMNGRTGTGTLLGELPTSLFLLLRAEDPRHQILDFLFTVTKIIHIYRKRWQT